MIKSIVREEKGFILILALVTMVAMTVIGISIVMNITTDMQLARNEREAKMSFQLANAGVNEASARLHLPSTNARYVGEKSTDAGYRTTAWAGYTFNSDPAVVGSLGTNRGYTVTVKYLDETNPEGLCNDVNPPTPDSSANVPPTQCRNNPPEIVMYGQDFNLTSAQTSLKYGQLPIYKISATGTSNGTSRTIVSYLGESKLNTDTTNAINTNACVAVNGGSNTITGGVVQGPGCGCNAQINGGCLPNKTATTDMNTYLGDSIANIMTYADQVHSCTNPSCNAPGNDIPTSGKLDGVITNWGSIGGNEGQLIVVNNSGGVDASLSGNVDAEGILIVTGNLVISGNVKFEGLLYVMGTLTVSGSVNVDGGLMANNTVTFNGAVTAKYDLGDLQEVSRQTKASGLTIWKRL